MSFLVDLVLFFLGFSRMKVDDSCYLIFCLFFSLNAKVWFIFIHYLCGCFRALFYLWGWAVEFFLLQLVGRVSSNIFGFVAPGVLQRSRTGALNHCKRTCRQSYNESISITQGKLELNKTQVYEAAATEFMEEPGRPRVGATRERPQHGRKARHDKRAIGPKEVAQLPDRFSSSTCFVNCRRLRDFTQGG